MAFGGPPDGSFQFPQNIHEQMRNREVMMQAILVAEYAKKFAEEGKQALSLDDYDSAREKFQYSYDMVHNLPPELGCPLLYEILKLQVEVNMKKPEWYHAAFKSAGEMIEINPQEWNGYWSMGTTCLLLDKPQVAFQVFCDGFQCVPADSEWELDFVVMISKLVSRGQDWVENCNIPLRKKRWQKVLEKLSSTNDWETIDLLVNRLPGEVYRLEGAAKGCGAAGINVGTLLNHLGNQALAKWGQKLAVTLLKEGASLTTVISDGEDVPFIVALQLSLKTGCLDLLKYILEIMTDPEEQNKVDSKGDYAFHIIVKSQWKNATVCETATRLLLNHHFAHNQLDRHGKLPIDYLTSTDQVFSLLNSTEKQLKQLKERVDFLKDKGNAADKKGNSIEALKFYTEAIGLAKHHQSLSRELSMLFTNRSLVNKKLNRLPAALQDSEYAISHDSTWPKGYWRKGQILKVQGDFDNACRAFLDGYTYGEKGENSVLCLTEAVSIISKLTDQMPIVKRLETVEKSAISAVIERLAKNCDWSSLSLLVLETCDNQDVSYAAGGASAQGVSVTPLALEIETSFKMSDKWKSYLLLALLSLGAPLSALSAGDHDTVYHAALRLTLHTENLKILEAALMSNLDEAKRVVNKAGDSLFHKLVKSQKANHPIGVEAAQVLILTGFDPTLKDARGKIPQDYVPSNSEVAKMIRKLTAQPKKNEDYENVMKLKETGNKAIAEMDFQNAVIFYTSAIDLSENIVALDNHERAVLLSNRSNAFLKLQAFDKALEDAKACVALDFKWFKGHYRVARSFVGMGKFKEASVAFKNAYKFIPDHTSDISLGILTDFCDLCHHNSEVKFNQVIPSSALICARVIHRLVSNQKIDAAHRTYQESFKKCDLKAKEVLKGALTLASFYSVQQLFPCAWIQSVITYLISVGADRTTLRQRDRRLSTHMHIAVFSSFMSGCLLLLEYLLSKARNTPEMNVVNDFKETALHLATWLEFDKKTQLDIVMHLCECGTDASLRNLDGQLAVDILQGRGREKSRQYLKSFCKGQQASSGVKHTQKPKVSEKTQGRQAKQNNMKPCDRCELNLTNAQEYQSKGLNTEAIDSVCQFVNISSHKEDRHQILSKDGIEVILVILRLTPRPEIPKSLLKVKDKVYQTLIRTLADEDRWRQVETLIRAWTEDKPLSVSIATGISIGDVIKSDSLQGDPNYRKQVIELLLKNGACLQASPEKSEEPISIAISKNDFRVIPVLIDHGASPSHIKLSPDDKPLHTSLHVALQLDKGYFGLFEKLLNLAADMKETSGCLDMCSVDAEGNSLYHMAAKCDYSKHAQRAIEMLLEKCVPGGETNNSGYTPLDYIVKPNDRRKQYLNIAAESSVGKKENTKKAKGHSSRSLPSKRGISKLIQKTLQKDDESKRVDEVPDAIEEVDKYNVSKPTDISSLLKKKLQDCRETVRFHINQMPDYVLPEPVVKKERNKLDDIDSDLESSPRSSRPSSPLDLTEAIEQSLLDRDDDDDDDDGNTPQEPMEINAQLFDDLEWEVECTADVWKILKDKRIPFELKRTAIFKIQKLASGEWTDSLTKKVHNVPKSLELFEAKISKGGRILWELAVAFSPRSNESPDKILSMNEEGCMLEGKRHIYAQVIRVWDIVLQHDQLFDRIQKVARSHGRGEESIIKKNLQSLSKNQTKISDNSQKRLPILFIEMEDGLSNELQKEALPFFPPASPSETEYHIMKFYSFSPALVKYILQKMDTKVDFPFRVTDLEHAIISLKSSSPILLLGRSGTGKTTCCLYRLWKSYMGYWTKALIAEAPLLPRTFCFVKHEEQDGEQDEEDEAASENNDSEKEIEEACTPEDDTEGSDTQLDHLQQVFVTKNAVLCSEVMKNFQDLSHASDFGFTSSNLDDQPLPKRFQDIDASLFPLFLTSRQLLLMLDASLSKPAFFERHPDGSLKRDVEGWTDDNSPLAFIPDLDSDSENEDDDLEGSTLLNDEEAPTETGARSKTTRRRLDPRKEVTYEVFSEELWPRLKSKKKIKYHPSLVWTEINSFIKGSFEAINTSSGCLDLDMYEKLGKKRAPNFCGDRRTVFEIFHQYEHVKKQKGMFDECDLLLDIYRRVCNTKSLDWVIHQLYVDETQDFTQAELCLLLRLCQNPNDMFLTGDTAQGIMRGISFRFSDLKSLFHYAKQSFKVMGKSEAISVPKRFCKLTHNYRSHAGILSLASSVVDLMEEFFPESFDHLQNDQGLFNGPLPVLLESCSFSDLALLLRGNRRQTSEIEFGAHQAILVLNNESREALPEELQLGLVLTIFEAKGLEFDDVLLFNFFKDSQAGKEWRVVTDFLKRLTSPNTTGNTTKSLAMFDFESLEASSCRPLTFNPEQHKVLCSELKHLYTALTRARVHVWIFDEDVEARAPMFDYFKARRLVQTITVNEKQSEGITDAMFAEKSSPADWIRRGDDFMKHRLYSVAAKCYEKAGNEEKESQALAHSSALMASRLFGTPAKMREEFLLAAEQYLVKCGMNLEAARCLQNARERKLAARLYEKIGQFEKAGSLYKKCNIVLDASRCLEQQGHYRETITLLTDNDMYDEAIDVIKRYQIRTKEYQGRRLPVEPSQHSPSERQTVDRLTYKSAGWHHKRGSQKEMLAALDRLPNPDDRISFLKREGLAIHAVDILKDCGRYQEAADVLQKEGRFQEACKCAESAHNDYLVSKCRLLMYKQQVSNWQDGQPEVVLKKELTEVTACFKQVKDFDAAADASLLLGKLSSDIKMVEESWTLYGNVTPSNEAGQVECTKVYLNLVTLNLDSNICYKFATKHLQKLFTVLTITQQTSMNGTNKQKAQVYEKFYGFETTHETMMEFNDCLYPKCLEFLGSSHSPVKRDTVNQHLRKYLLELVCDWVNFLIEACKTLLAQNRQCEAFVQGLVCTDKLCANHHDHMSRKTFFKVFKCLLSCVHIEAEISTACDSIQDSYIQNRLCSLLTDGKFYYSRKLLNFIVPERQVIQCASQSRDYMREFLDHLRQPVLFKHYKIVMECNWQISNPLARTSGTDVFVTGKIHSQIFGKKVNYVSAWLKETEQDHSKKARDKNISKDEGKTMIVDQTTSKKHFMCYSQRFVAALDLIYNPTSNANEGLVEFAKFLKLLSNRKDLSIFPSYPHLILWMEFFLIADLSLGAKHFETFIILPSGYMDVVSFVDSIFTGKNIGSLNEAIQISTKHCKIGQRGRNMIDMLLWREKDTGHGTTLLAELFNPQKEYLDNGVAERVLIFCLTLLSNVNGVIPGDCENRLVQKLTQVLSIPALSEKKLSPRMLNAITQILKAKGQHDIVRALEALLLAKDQQKLLRCDWVRNKYNPYKEILHKKTFTDYLELASKFGSSVGIRNPEVLHAFEVQRSATMAIDTEEEDEMGMTGEELKQRDERQDEDKERKAAKTLTRFIRHIHLRKRAEHLYDFVRNELSKEEKLANPLTHGLDGLFSTCMIDHTMCGICGVTFTTQQDVYGDGNTKGELAENSTSPGYESIKEAYHSHIIADSHYDHDEDYMELRRYIRSEVVPLFSEIQQIVSQQGRLQDVALDVDRLRKGREDLIEELRQIAQDRKWAELVGLQKSVESLQTTFKVVRPMISKCLQEKQVPTGGDGQSVKPKQDSNSSRLSDGYDEEDDLEKVVEEPKTANQRSRRYRKNKRKRDKKREK